MSQALRSRLERLERCTRVASGDWPAFVRGLQDEDLDALFHALGREVERAERGEPSDPADRATVARIEARHLWTQRPRRFSG